MPPKFDFELIWRQMPGGGLWFFVIYDTTVNKGIAIGWKRREDEARQAALAFIAKGG